ncbi:MAG: aminoacyl-histidine dipeptidase [Oscillospiraceae bacterium]|nr:aminoacyl-histidine dipeptidase [Oscillospiraceae bacterium]
MDFNSLDPKEVFYYFHEISQIPRGSGNEKGVSDYLKKFGESLGLKTIQDDVLNVIIKKPGTKGYENSDTVILQGHMDMVCEKNKDTVHDFLKDPIDLYVDGDYIKARGTTLGADNGIAVAMIMEILASKKIEHPPIEALFTTNEEVGMTGAFGLDPENIEGRYLINVDSEEEGSLLVSCAGGVTNTVMLPIQKTSKAKKDFYSIFITGLFGGHSGIDINKERGNANKLLGRLLNSLRKELDFELVSINGGSKNNAITRESEAIIGIEEKDSLKLQESVKAIESIFKNELRASDPGIMIKLDNAIAPTEVLSEDSKEKAIDLLYLLPHGVNSISVEIKDLVVSSNNLGVVITHEDAITFEGAVRSSVSSLKDEITDRIEALSNLVGAACKNENSYPAWSYNSDSKLREKMVQVFKKMYGKEPNIAALHAGLECGLFGDKIKGLDMISLGPNLKDVHTPNEKLSISSTKRVWEYLIEVLKSFKA